MSYLTQTTMRALRAAPIAPRLRSIALRPAALALARPFSSTQYRRASEVPKDPIADPEIQGFYEKLRNHQGAVDAMMKMAELMKEKGIDTSKPPSKMQMLKLSFDADMREAGQNLVEQMKAAGVEMNPEGLYKKMQ